MANGTPIYFIPRMEDDGPVKTDGILVIQADGSAQVYMNDYKHEFFELFTDLRPLYWMEVWDSFYLYFSLFYKQLES